VTMTDDDEATVWQQRWAEEGREPLPPPEPDEVELTADDMEGTANAMAEATRPDEPEIRSPGDGIADLFFGVERDGQRYRRAEVRELTGADEEALSRIDNNKEDFYALLQDTILRRATVKIGEVVVADDPKVIGSLLMGDRDVLFMQILVATYGETKEYTELICPACQGYNDIEVDIPELVERTGGPVDSIETTVKLRNGNEVKLHYPTGADQLFAWSQKPGATDQERNTYLIQRCVVTDVGNRHDWALKLGMADRRKVMAALAEGPAITFKEVKVPCVHCGEDLPVVFSWADLLLV